ncbi:hypothetical protein GDO86_012076, partial [Hymenochirus boettgeri]
MQRYANSIPASRCFSVIFKGQRKNLNLIANSETEAAHWTSGLNKILKTSKAMSQDQKAQHWIYTCLRKADKNKDSKITLKEIKSFLQEINFETDDQHTKEIFMACDTSKSGTLEGEEIENFYQKLTWREEIDVIFNCYSNNRPLMTAENLLNFLRKEQRENVDIVQAKSLIEKYEPSDVAKKQNTMTKDGLLIYLLSDDGNIFNTSHCKVYQDMNQPLSHYYISSSHNTYLMEDQLGGASSTEAYVRALSKGCRCVEIDCWDGPHQEPIVYHGYTLTSRILFKDVITTIKKYAFKTSPYPVILSLENHCSLDQQIKMAEHLKSILGDMLLTAPLEGKLKAFPSPEQLKGKILIKGKKLDKLGDRPRGESSDVMESADVSDEDEAAEMADESVKSKVKESKTKATLKLAKELSDLVIYCKSVHFGGFDHAMEHQSFNEMSSLVEGKAQKLGQESGVKFIKHNTRQLIRIYPDGIRTDSSNYSPVQMWNVGCQIVALNFQTPCTQMDLYQGRFQDNGSCGYVLKPPFLRQPEPKFNPRSVQEGEWLTPKKLHIMVISAQQLPKVNQKPSSIVDPFVRVEIHGVERDRAKKETSYIENNGFNPSWSETFVFEIDVPALALVRFVVEDYDTSSRNDFVGQYTTPLTSLKLGYRHVHLVSKSGDPYPSATLFVHIMLVD